MGVGLGTTYLPISWRGWCFLSRTRIFKTQLPSRHIPTLLKPHPFRSIRTNLDLCPVFFSLSSPDSSKMIGASSSSLLNLPIPRAHPQTHGVESKPLGYILIKRSSAMTLEMFQCNGSSDKGLGCLLFLEKRHRLICFASSEYFGTFTLFPSHKQVLAAHFR